MNGPLCYHDSKIVIMGAKGMVRTQIQLTDNQARDLKRLAAARHLSMAELIRQGVDAILRSNTVMDIAEKRKRALALAGRYRSSKHDISKEHDKYLAEDYGK
jgi:predicted DNA-binding ribbon-helix-helix protein